MDDKKYLDHKIEYLAQQEESMKSDATNRNTKPRDKKPIIKPQYLNLVQSELKVFSSLESYKPDSPFSLRQQKCYRDLLLHIKRGPEQDFIFFIKSLLGDVEQEPSKQSYK